MTMDPEYCHLCDTNFPSEDELYCYECMDKLRALMKATTPLESGSPVTPAPVYSPSIQFKNVRLSSDYPGEAIIAIDGTGAAGVQKPFKFDGQGKCIVCEELTTDAMVCQECTDAIYLTRTFLHNKSVTDFLELFGDEGFVALLKFVSSNAVRKYMEAEIEQFGES